MPERVAPPRSVQIVGTDVVVIWDDRHELIKSRIVKGLQVVQHNETSRLSQQLIYPIKSQGGIPNGHDFPYPESICNGEQDIIQRANAVL